MYVYKYTCVLMDITRAMMYDPDVQPKAFD